MPDLDSQKSIRVLLRNINIIDAEMTLPDERYRAVLMAERFMSDLCDPTVTPRVPKQIRDRARGVLRHYPSTYDLDRLAEKSPDVIIAKMEPLTRLVMSYEQEKTHDNAS